MGPMTLPPGFRFHPTDDELVGYYLKRRVDGQTIELEVIPVIDLYKFDPWELPEKSFLPKRDMEWFFFCPRDKKYPNGSRTNRATASGYWKATGKDRKVFCESSVQGLRKTLVFYRGRAPGGERTDWVMHEYRLCEDLSQPIPNFLGGFALCRVVKRNEQGLKIADSFGESKGKRSFASVDTDCGPRKNFSKGMSSSEVHSPQANSLFEISNELQPIAAATYQTSFWESMYLCDVPEIINSLDESLLPESTHPVPFLNSNESCPSNSISPVSSYASCMEEELNPHGDFSPFLSLLPHTNVYCNADEMGFQGFEWEMPGYVNSNTNGTITGFEASNNVLSPSICRQASDCEDTGLWLLDDSLLVVM